MDNSRRIINNWILFLLWPFGSFLSVLKNIRAVNARNLIWAYCSFYGFTMITTNEGADSFEIKKLLQVMHQNSFDFKTLWDMTYTESGTFVDIFQPIITFLVAQFTDDSRILFCIFGFIFGYFYSSNITYLSRKIENKGNKWSIYLLLIFALIIPIWDINGFRFWTAAQVFLYGTLPFLLDNNKKLLKWSIMSVFVHFSFSLPVMTLLVFFIIGNRLYLFFTIFIFTLTISELNIPVLKSLLLLYTPDLLLPRVNGYLNTDYIKSIEISSENLNWYVRWGPMLFKYILVSFIIVIMVFHKQYILNNKNLKNIFCITLLFFAFSNITNLLPSGGRFAAITYSFSIIFIMLFIQKYELYGKVKYLLYSSIPIFALFALIRLRIGLYFTGLSAVFANPFIAPFLN